MLRPALALTVVLVACSQRDRPMPAAETSDYARIGLSFVQALASRDYSTAYATTSKAFQRGTTLEALRAAFEAIVPTSWPTVGPVEVGYTLDTWPDKQVADLGWVYISIGGDVYSEALTVVVTREAGALKVRSVEFGRP